MTKFYLSSLFVLFFGSFSAQNFNRPIPNAYPPYEFRQFQTGSDSLFYLVTPTSMSPTSNYNRHLSLMDQNGYISWYTDGKSTSVINFQYHPLHQKFSYATFGDTITDAKFVILDSNFNKIDSIQPTAGAFNDMHDILILDNGNYLIMGYKNSVIDLSAYTFNGSPGSANTTLKDAIIQEFDTNHNLVFEWNSVDHIHPSDYIDGYSYNVNNFDYVHINAFEIDDDGNILVSMRHTDAIYKINKTTGNLMWTLGGKSNQFTFINDNNGFSGQHDIRRLSNGNISLFDNANNQPTPKRSRGKEYTLDTVSMTCTKVYQYTYTPSFYARAMGNFQTNNNGDRLIGYGMVYRPYPNFVHVDDMDNIKAELFFEDSVVSYRAKMNYLPFSLPTPTIDCAGGSGTATLTAPFGHTEYMWSTGETTQSILVADTGTYQAWVNYGIGMLGTEPIFISDIQNPCNTVGVESITNTLPKKIVGVYDLLGREIKKPKVSQIYVVRYNNGSGELIQWNLTHRINE